MSLIQVLTILRQRLGLIGITLASTLVGALLFLLIMPARYEAVSSASLDAGALDPLSNTQVVGPGNTLVFLQGNLVALAKSNQVAVEVVKRMNLASDPQLVAAYQVSKTRSVMSLDQWLANELLQNIDAKFGQQSNVLNITYKTRDPVRGAAIANAFLSAFIDAAIAMKNAYAQQSADWFKPQIERLREDLGAANEALVNFQVANSVIAQSSAADAENEQLSTLTTQLAKAKSDLLSLETQLAGSPASTAGSSEAQMVDQQTLATLRSNLSLVDTEIAKLQKDLGANNPKLQERLATKKALLEQIHDLEESHYQKISERIKAARARVDALEKAKARELRQMIDVQAKRAQLTSLVHEVEARQTELERATHAAAQARLQGQFSFSNISVLDKAVPPAEASFPKAVPVIAAAGLLGLFMGMIGALFAEVLDRRIRCVADVEFATGAPCLGELLSTRAEAGHKVNRFHLVAKLIEKWRPTPLEGSS